MVKSDSLYLSHLFDRTLMFERLNTLRSYPQKPNKSTSKHIKRNRFTTSPGIRATTVGKCLGQSALLRNNIRIQLRTQNSAQHIPSVSWNVAGRKIPEPNNSMEVSILSMGKSSRNEDFTCSKLLIQDKQPTDRLADCSKMLKAWFYFRSIWTWKPSWLPRPPPDPSPPASSQSS